MESATFLVSAVAALVITTSISAQSIWNETNDGDLSSDHLNPSGPVNLSLGSNTITGNTVAGDRDYLAVTVPLGFELEQIFVDSFSGDDLAFIAIQQGLSVTDPDAPDVSQLLGWTHFGPTEGNVGTNILDDIGQGAGAIGFTGPLGAGTYSLWIQETGGIAVDYQLDLIVTEIPAPASLAMLACAVFISHKRRR